jgi:hypothetical protein
MFGMTITTVRQQMAQLGLKGAIKAKECCVAVLGATTGSIVARLAVPGTIQTTRATSLVFGFVCLPCEDSNYPLLSFPLQFLRRQAINFC